MASLSLKLILHSKRYSDGTAPLMLQCIVGKTDTEPAQTTRLTLTKVQPEHYDPASGRVTRKHPNYIAVNALISRRWSDAEQRKIDAERTGVVNIDYILSGEVKQNASAPANRATLFVHGQQYADARRQRGMLSTAEKYDSHVEQLRLFLNETDVALADIDEAWVLRFVEWLRLGGRSRIKGKGRAVKSPNTLHRRMKFLNGLFIDARKRGLMTHDPMLHLTFKPTKARKPKLSVDQVEVLKAAQGLSERETLARDTFLLQLWAYGSRISDVLMLTTSNLVTAADGTYLSYNSMKTGQQVTVRLPGEAVTMLARYTPAPDELPYLLPWMRTIRMPTHAGQDEQSNYLRSQIESKTQLCNKALKRIAERTQISINLTTHIARHTFANLADQRVTDKRKISAALGHTKFSTTEIYLSDLRSNEINDAMDEIWK